MGLAVLANIVPANGGVLYSYGDHLGSVNLTTDQNGDVIESVSYSPFGELIQETASNLPTNHLYTGQELDPESALHYYGARYYDFTLSRFTSRDPVLENLPYSYVSNNPIRLIDPSGRDEREKKYHPVNFGPGDLPDLSNRNGPGPTAYAVVGGTLLAAGVVVVAGCYTGIGCGPAIVAGSKISLGGLAKAGILVGSAAAAAWAASQMASSEGSETNPPAEPSVKEIEVKLGNLGEPVTNFFSEQDLAPFTGETGWPVHRGKIARFTLEMLRREWDWQRSPVLVYRIEETGERVVLSRHRYLAAKAAEKLSGIPIPEEAYLESSNPAELLSRERSLSPSDVEYFGGPRGTMRQPDYIQRQRNWGSIRLSDEPFLADDMD